MVKRLFCGTALLAAPLFLAACAGPVRRVAIPPATDRSAYQPVPYEKPLPPDATGYSVNPYQHVPLHSEAAFVRAYRKARDPRLMVLVHSDVKGNAYDRIAASAGDYNAIAVSLIDYLNANGQIDILNGKMVRAKLGREKFLAVQNGDPAVLPLLKHALQTDVLIDVSASPTSQSSSGSAVRLTAEALSTTDARILGAESVDMPLPMSRSNINMYTRFLAEKLMEKMVGVWNHAGPHGFNPLIVRIYKARTVDSVLRIRRLIQKVPGVREVIDRGITGSRRTSYGTLAVRYDGSPDRFYTALKRRLRHVRGLRAIDIQRNTIDLQVAGRMDLRTTRTTTRVETRTRTVIDRPVRPSRQ